jgi:hypothetical protein
MAPLCIDPDLLEVVLRNDAQIGPSCQYCMSPPLLLSLLGHKLAVQVYQRSVSCRGFVTPTPWPRRVTVSSLEAAA